MINERCKDLANQGFGYRGFGKERVGQKELDVQVTGQRQILAWYHLDERNNSISPPMLNLKTFSAYKLQICLCLCPILSQEAWDGITFPLTYHRRYQNIAHLFTGS
jgi:hypothetical protein